MYYLLFSNLKKSIKKTIILILTIPIFIAFIIYSINQNANIYANVPDSVIYYVFIPLLVLYYIFINYFIIRNLILEASYLKERVKYKYINVFYITINVLFACIVIASIVYIYAANVKFYTIETLYWEYDCSYQVLKSYNLVSLFSIMYTKKVFTLIFMIFQISISVISLINIIKNNIRTREILTVINICLSIMFIILWTLYPRIFVEILQEIRFIPVD